MVYRYTSLLKYVFRLVENVSRVVGQNSLPWGEQNSLTLQGNNNFRLARDQVVLLETAANLWDTRLKQTISLHCFFFYFWVGRYKNTLKVSVSGLVKGDYWRHFNYFNCIAIGDMDIAILLIV